MLYLDFCACFYVYNIDFPLTKYCISYINRYLCFFKNRTVLEELSVRADIALSQKKVIQEITSNPDDEDFQRDYHALSAQVVSIQIC